ncbi:Sugar transporter 11 [Operophtera brumata]|uniref:Sugar transporter 11 n=1 Tax=Operophtera brumata TaxID=104452 RepID=A0A0L7LC51_OPEBR|nr:Sugar transporter 11 [Operophtera brumata]
MYRPNFRSLGCLLVTFCFAGYLADKIGRKYSLIIACLPRIITSFIFIYASQVWMFLLGRGICGISDAFTVHITATYTSEIASKGIRGGLGTISQIWSSLGGMIILITGPYVSYDTINIIHTSIVIGTGIPLLFLPESPYFLYSIGRSEESLRLLISLRGSETIAKEEIKEYSINNDHGIRVNKLELLKEKNALKTVGKVMFLGMGYMLTGYTSASFHLQTIFEMTHTSVSSEISSAIIGVIAVFACCCTIYLSDRFGRKPVLTMALIGQGLGMIGLGTFFKLTEGHYAIVGFLNYLPLLSIGLVIYSYNAGLGSLIWILFAELFDGRLRAFGVSAGGVMACIFGFLTIRFLNNLMDNIGPAPTYWVFGGFCVCTCLFILFFIPETKVYTPEVEASFPVVKNLSNNKQ